MPKVILGETMYTLQEVAELLSVTTRTMLNYMKNKRIVGQKIGGRWYYTEENVKAFLQGKNPPKQP